jgi:hypothetical protein
MFKHVEPDQDSDHLVDDYEENSTIVTEPALMTGSRPKSKVAAVLSTPLYYSKDPDQIQDSNSKAIIYPSTQTGSDTDRQRTQNSAKPPLLSTELHMACDGRHKGKTSK